MNYKPLVTAAILFGLFVDVETYAAPPQKIICVIQSHHDEEGLPACPSQAARTSTIEDAIALVQNIRSTPSAAYSSISVVVYPGTYRLRSTVTINAMSDASRHAPLTFAAARNGTVWISGAKPAGAMRPLDANEKTAFAPQVQNQIRVLDLPQGVSKLNNFSRKGKDIPSGPSATNVFYKDEPLQIVRWPENDFSKISNVSINGPQTIFSLQGQPSMEAENLWATGYWEIDWKDDTFPASLQGTNLIIEPEKKSQLKAKIGQRVFLFNSKSFFFHQNQWQIDYKNNKIYIWPQENANQKDFYISDLENLFIIDGARDISFRGINFEEGRGSAIVAKNISNLSIFNCKVRNFGSIGVSITGNNALIKNCEISGTGEGGISLSGGNLSTLAAGNLRVSDSQIHNYNQVVRTYRPGVFLRGVGNSVSNSAIFDSTHSGIIFYGNDHQIVNNDMYNLAVESSDAGAIYTGREILGRGNLIQDNFIHDIQGISPWHATGVYLDDQSGGDTIKGNVFFNVYRGILIGGGSYNSVIQNIFLNNTITLRLDDRGLGAQKYYWRTGGAFLTSLDSVDLNHGVYAKYSGLAHALQDDPGAPKQNIFSHNVVVGGDWLDSNAKRILAGGKYLTQTDNKVVEGMPLQLHGTVSRAEVEKAAQSYVRDRKF